MDTPTSKTHLGIDIFRLIAAFMVVVVHTKPGYEYSDDIGFFFTQIFPRLGVPFFFCVSGFFLYGRINNQPDLLKHVNRLLLFYILWSIIYLPMDVLYPLIRSGNFNWVKYIISFFITGTHYHLWYMPALLISIYMIYFIRKTAIIGILAIVFYIIGLLGCSYYEIGINIPILNTILENHYNYFNILRRIFFMGFPFVSIGYILSTQKEVIINISKKQSSFFLVGAVTLFIAEILLLCLFGIEKNIIITIFLPLLVISFFIKGYTIYTDNSYINNNKTINQSILYRSMSNCIYFIHPLVLISISIVGNYMFSISLLIRFPTMCLLGTFLISALIGYLIVRINNPKLNILIK